MDDELIDTYEASELLEVKPNNLRQMTFQKKITPTAKRGRRSLYNKQDVLNLKASRMKELKTTETPIAVSQQDHPQEI